MPPRRSTRPAWASSPQRGATFADLATRLDAALADPATTGGPDKVVLYVGDLDRCREQRVVEVLEAVHLLLDHFIVVVAVDSRWLVRALELQYQNMLGTSERADDESPTSGHWSATPLNYLERIFQTPLARPAIGSTGSPASIGTPCPWPQHPRRS